MLFQRLVAVVACCSLTACGLPRGAGFQSEVLAASNANTAAEGEEPEYDFAVYEVNRSTLPVLNKWPATGPGHMSWPTARSQPASLLIASGDTVQLTIWDAEENSVLAGAGGFTPLQPIQVASNGRIFVPYIGELRVAGMSPSTARTRIEEELIRTIPSAQVQLVVEPGRQNTANLSSGVALPGLYPLLDRDVRILDLFSEAGGPSPDLVSPQVRLVRDGRTFGVSFETLQREPSLNVALRGGDRIYLVDDERKFIALGATGTQSIFDFPETDLSALEAISLIGGVNSGSANPEGILILREYATGAVRDGVSGPPKERVVFTIDLTTADGLFSAGKFMLEGDDLIYGTESVFGPALNLVSIASTLSSVVTGN